MSYHHGASRDVRGARRLSSRSRCLLTMACGAALVLAGTASATDSGPHPGAASPRVQELAAPAQQPAASGTVPVRSGDLTTVTPDTAPTRLRIPALRVSAAVDGVGVDPQTGALAVPARADHVGWYRFGPGVNATGGSIVIAGHVDSAIYGRGALFALRTLDEGDLIELDDGTGAARRFHVVAVEQFRKSTIPLQRYFARDGVPRLTLITCGGPFDRASANYRDNVVVTAAAADDPPLQVPPRPQPAGTTPVYCANSTAWNLSEPQIPTATAIVRSPGFRWSTR